MGTLTFNYPSLSLLAFEPCILSNVRFNLLKTVFVYSNIKFLIRSTTAKWVKGVKATISSFKQEDNKMALTINIMANGVV